MPAHSAILERLMTSPCRPVPEACLSRLSLHLDQPRNGRSPLSTIHRNSAQHVPGRGIAGGRDLVAGQLGVFGP